MMKQMRKNIKSFCHFLSKSDKEQMKVVMVGDTQVGKYCIIERVANNKFKPNTSPTIGAAFQTRVISTLRGSVTIQIWDTAGQEKYRALAPMYFRSADIAVLCFDVTNIDSFMSLDAWINELNQKAPEHTKLVIAGNKIDMREERVIEKERAREYSENNGAVGYIEVSAKTGDGIEELFDFVANVYLDYKETMENAVAPVKNELTNDSEKSKCC